VNDGMPHLDFPFFNFPCSNFTSFGFPFYKTLIGSVASSVPERVRASSR
jgi:hypothetical protein